VPGSNAGVDKRTHGVRDAAGRVLGAQTGRGQAMLTRLEGVNCSTKATFRRFIMMSRVSLRDPGQVRELVEHVLDLHPRRRRPVDADRRAQR
jgi:hypothetical protein